MTDQHHVPSKEQVCGICGCGMKLLWRCDRCEVSRRAAHEPGTGAADAERYRWLRRRIAPSILARISGVQREQLRDSRPEALDIALDEHLLRSPQGECPTGDYEQAGARSLGNSSESPASTQPPAADDREELLNLLRDAFPVMATHAARHDDKAERAKGHQPHIYHQQKADASNLWLDRVTPLIGGKLERTRPTKGSDDAG